MVETANSQRSKAVVGGPSDQNDQGNFRIIHDFFRDRFNNYFSSLQQAKFLIIEESLANVIKFLLSPVDAKLQIRGFAQL